MFNSYAPDTHTGLPRRHTLRELVSAAQFHPLYKEDLIFTKLLDIVDQLLSVEVLDEFNDVVHIDDITDIPEWAESFNKLVYRLESDVDSATREVEDLECQIEELNDLNKSLKHDLDDRMREDGQEGQIRHFKAVVYNNNQVIADLKDQIRKHQTEIRRLVEQRDEYKSKLDTWVAIAT